MPGFSYYNIKRSLIIFSIWLTLTSSAFSDSRSSNTQCLAETMYHEARGTTQQEQLLVAQVVLNRVTPGDTLCGVVYKPNQFSWTKNHKPHKVPTYYNQLATTILERGYAVEGFKATHFHNFRVRPQWRLKLVLKTKYHYYYV